MSTKKLVALLLCALVAFSFASCGQEETEPPAEAFGVNVVCESHGIYQIYYSCYLNNEYYGMGGMADFDKRELNEASKLQLTFSKAYFNNRPDVSGFSIDFSPYGENDVNEIGTSNRVNIPAKYGESYTIVFSGSADTGFTAKLKQ